MCALAQHDTVVDVKWGTLGNTDVPMHSVPSGYLKYMYGIVQMVLVVLTAACHCCSYRVMCYAHATHYCVGDVSSTCQQNSSMAYCARSQGRCIVFELMFSCATH